MTDFVSDLDDAATGGNGPPGAAAVGHVIVAARDEADRIAETVKALHDVFGAATVVVCDDGSADDTAAVAESAGAVVVGAGHHQGKGQAASLGAARALADGPPEGASVVLLADADLARSAARLAPLAATVAARRQSGRRAGQVSIGQQYDRPRRRAVSENPRRCQRCRVAFALMVAGADDHRAGRGRPHRSCRQLSRRRRPRQSRRRRRRAAL